MLRGFLGSALENDGWMPRASGLRSQVQSCPRALKARQGPRGFRSCFAPAPLASPPGQASRAPGMLRRLTRLRALRKLANHLTSHAQTLVSSRPSARRSKCPWLHLRYKRTPKQPPPISPIPPQRPSPASRRPLHQPAPNRRIVQQRQGGVKSNQQNKGPPSDYADLAYLCPHARPSI